MIRKGIAILLSALMVWALALPAGATVNPFSDVSSDHWAYEAIVRLANAGLIEGYPDGTFGGDRSFTRYEMAMVFARILARFEALIDQKIAEGIDAKTAALANEIEEARRALTKLLQENYDELVARIARLEDGGIFGAMTVDEQSGELSLSPEARAALASLVADELVRRLDALDSDLDALARRVLRLEGSTPSRSEAELIAQRVIADALADNGSELSSALSAVRGDLGSLVELLDQKVNVLAHNMERLADEFENELRLLGARVAKLEEDVDYLTVRSDNLVLTGTNESRFEIVRADGAAPYFRDPRNYDLDDDGDLDLFPNGDLFENRLSLALELVGSKGLSFGAGLVAATDIVAGDQNEYYHIATSGDFDRLNFSLNLSGELNGVNANLGEAAVGVPLGIASLGLKYGAAGVNFPEQAYLDRPLRSNLEDWLVNHLDPKSDYVGVGESRYEATLSVPLGGLRATIAAGQVDRSLVAGDTNDFLQLQVDGLEFAGISTSVLYDTRTNQSDDADNTLRAVLGANLFGVDLEATVHQRTNEQAVAGEQEQRGSWLKASREFSVGLPLSFDARFGMNQELDAQYFRLGLGAEYPLGALRVTGGFSLESKALGRLGEFDDVREIDEFWWLNAPWNVTDDPRTIATVGAVYGIEDLLGAAVEVGYELQTVSVGNNSAGTRNTLRTTFHRALSADGGSLSGEVKLVTGGLEATPGTVALERNEQDLVAKVNFAYPVFEGGEVTLGGEYASSQGAVANEYQAYSLKAGLTVSF